MKSLSATVIGLKKRSRKQIKIKFDKKVQKINSKKQVQNIVQKKKKNNPQKKSFIYLCIQIYLMESVI